MFSIFGRVVSDASQRALNQMLGLRPGDKDIRVHLKRHGPELAAPDDVGNGLAVQATRHTVLKLKPLCRSWLVAATADEVSAA